MGDPGPFAVIGGSAGANAWYDELHADPCQEPSTTAMPRASRTSSWASSWSAASIGSSSVGRIVETEAYLGPPDLAAHSSHGPDRAYRGHVRPAGTCLRVLDLWHAPLPERRDRARATIRRRSCSAPSSPSPNLDPRRSGPGRLCRALADRPPAERPRPDARGARRGRAGRTSEPLRDRGPPPDRRRLRRRMGRATAPLLHRRQPVHLARA